MTQSFSQLLLSVTGLSAEQSALTVLIAFIVMAVIGLLLFVVAKSYVMPALRQLFDAFKPQLSKEIQQPLVKLSNRLSWLLPCLFFLVSLSWFVPQDLTLKYGLYKFLYIYLYFNITLILTSVLSILGIVYHRQSYAKDIHIKGVIQIIKLAVFMVFAVLTIAELMDKTPLYLLSSLGALTAVLLLIFKDTILGLVAGIQIATHRIVALGDWIEMSKFGADGEVLEVGLHTVKVKNWDNTITTIPTTSLISDSFKNWRSMSESGGRRIKRAIVLDINDIAIITADEHLQITSKLGEEFTQYCQQQQLAQTNIGLFRDYCEFHLINHPMINTELTLMARQLQPNEYGIAIELYCFCSDKSWVPYEKVQAQIIEHLLAMLHVFQLHAYQRPCDE